MPSIYYDICDYDRLHSGKERQGTIVSFQGLVESIAAGDYPLTDAYYAVFRKDQPEDSPVRQLLAWILSDEGQILMQSAGYVPLRTLE